MTKRSPEWTLEHEREKFEAEASTMLGYPVKVEIKLLGPETFGGVVYANSGVVVTAVSNTSGKVVLSLRRKLREALTKAVPAPPQEPPALGSVGRSSGRPPVARRGDGRGARRGSASGRAAPVPARRGHRADCKHRWCYCYTASHLDHPERPCQYCQRDQFNKEHADDVRHD